MVGYPTFFLSIHLLMSIWNATAFCHCATVNTNGVVIFSQGYFQQGCGKMEFKISLGQVFWPVFGATCIPCQSVWFCISVLLLMQLPSNTHAEELQGMAQTLESLTLETCMEFQVSGFGMDRQRSIYHSFYSSIYLSAHLSTHVSPIFCLLFFQQVINKYLFKRQVDIGKNFLNLCR